MVICQTPLSLRPVRAALATLIILLAMPLAANAQNIARFVGEFSGEAEIVSADGTTSRRDMSVNITKNRKGFTVQWTSITYKPGGRIKEKTYSVNFVRSDRVGIYSAAMARNVFGHAVQMDPMKGEPFVWGRIVGDTLTVFSLFVADDGGYEMQQYDRTLAEGGLTLEFSSLRNGAKQRSVSTFLTRQ